MSLQELQAAAARHLCLTGPVEAYVGALEAEVVRLRESLEMVGRIAWSTVVGEPDDPA